jgi:hypothetical protein
VRSRRKKTDTKETGGLTYHRSKTDIIASGRYIESDGLLWKLAPRAFSGAPQ